MRSESRRRRAARYGIGAAPAPSAGIALAICCFAPPALAADPAPSPPAVAGIDAQGGCVDEELKQELVAGRHYRGVQERLFTKAFRHELSAMGGLYAGDLYSSSWVAGGAYTFHFSEDLGLEASFMLTRFRTAVTDSYERRYPQVQVEERTNRPGRLYFGHLVWSFAYGKLRWMGGGITRFDFNAALGAGVTDDSTAQGLTGSFGLGTKWYLTKWLDVRVDIRDHILKETLIGEDHLVNDIIVTGGVSLFIPFGG